MTSVSPETNDKTSTRTEPEAIVDLRNFHEGLLLGCLQTPRPDLWRIQLSSVGDEHHFVFECPYFQPLRDRYHTLFSPQTISMRSFFAQKYRMNVFKFISDCLDMMNTQS